MKKVRYAVGAVAGLAPAFGALATANAASARTLPPPAPTAKTVVLPGNTAAGCAGHTKTPLKHGSGGGVSIEFWYTHEANNKTCIGTVDANTFVEQGEHRRYRWRFRIYSGTNKHKVFSHTYLTSKSHASPGIHRAWTNPIQVCAHASLHTSVWSPDGVGCQSVG